MVRFVWFQLAINKNSCWHSLRVAPKCTWLIFCGILYVACVLWVQCSLICMKDRNHLRNFCGTYSGLFGGLISFVTSSMVSFPSTLKARTKFRWTPKPAWLAERILCRILRRRSVAVFLEYILTNYWYFCGYSLIRLIIIRTHTPADTASLPNEKLIYGLTVKLRRHETMK